MATIGLDKLYYSKITENELGEETYDAPQVLAKAMTADLSVELNEATLYADDGAAEVVKEFKSAPSLSASTTSALRWRATLQAPPSIRTESSCPLPKTAATLSRSASGRRNPTANTGITGSTA